LDQKATDDWGLVADSDWDLSFPQECLFTDNEWMNLILISPGFYWIGLPGFEQIIDGCALWHQSFDYRYTFLYSGIVVSPTSLNQRIIPLS
jgi:hypothetical protein